MSDDTVIGVSRPRIDAPDKVTGATRFAADGYVHGLLHARPVLATEAHARIRGIDKQAALAIPGVVAVLGASDLPIASSGTDRTSEPLAREEVVFAGQPVALVIAETEAAAEDGAEAVIVDYEPLPAVVDVETAMAPGAPLARTVEETDDEAGDLESIHAGVDHGQEDDPTEELSRQRPRPHHSRERRRRRGVRCERGGRRGDVPDTVGLPGVPRAAGVHGMARAVRNTRRVDEHAGLLRDAERARAGIRSPARARSRDRGAARRRVRRQVRARRAARGRRRTRPEAPRPAGVHALGGLPGDEPGLCSGDASEDRRAGRRNAHGDRGAA